MSGTNKILALDPGHSVGNRNQSPDGSYFEWEFNQDVCDRAAKIIERIPGLDVVLTKQKDTTATLAERVKVAEEAGAGLFLSQHTNAFGTGDWTSPNGFGVYRYPGRNLALAQIGLKWCIELLPMNSRGIRERDFYVLRVPKMPSILFETGFHTNREDVAKLKDSGFRDKAAMVLVRTACEFLNVKYVESDDMADYVMVKPGDRFGRIASAHNMTVDELHKLNPHIDDPAVIYAEHGGDIIFLTEPNKLEREFGFRTRQYILVAKDLTKELEHCKEQYAQVSGALSIANRTVDRKRLLISDYEARMDKARAALNYK